MPKARKPKANVSRKKTAEPQPTNQPVEEAKAIEDMGSLELRQEADRLGLQYSSETSDADLVTIIKANMGEKVEEEPVDPDEPTGIEIDGHERQRSREAEEEQRVKDENVSEAELRKQAIAGAAEEAPPDPEEIADRTGLPVEIIQDNGQVIVEWVNYKIAPFDVTCTLDGIDQKPRQLKALAITVRRNGRRYLRYFYRIPAAKNALRMLADARNPAKLDRNFRVLNRKQLSVSIQQGMWAAEERQRRQAERHKAAMREENLKID